MGGLGFRGAYHHRRTSGFEGARRCAPTVRVNFGIQAFLIHRQPQHLKRHRTILAQPFQHFLPQPSIIAAHQNQGESASTDKPNHPHDRLQRAIVFSGDRFRMIRMSHIAEGRRQEAEGFLLLRSRLNHYECPNTTSDSYN